MTTGLITAGTEAAYPHVPSFGAEQCAGAWTRPEARLRLQAGELHTWLIALDRDQHELLDLRCLLSTQERERADRFHFERDRRRYIAGRGTLRQLLARYTRRPAEPLQFAYGRKGKPSLPGSAFQFNLSHSGGMAVLAVTQGRAVGIDIEHLRAVAGWQEVMKCCFSTKEQAAILDLPESEQQAAFLTCWTRKEAYVKATGDGLGIPLDRFSVDVEPGSEPALLEVLDLPSEAARWRFANLPVADGYIGVVAHDGAFDGIQHFLA
jgi:4'-phosphopantetheinyl transferase